MFHKDYEYPWRNLIQFIFKQYADGINLEKLFLDLPTNSLFEDLLWLFFKINLLIVNWTCFLKKDQIVQKIAVLINTRYPVS